MSQEVHALPAFYTSPPGEAARWVLAQALAGFWPALPRMEVAAVGWGQPYLPLWHSEAARCLALVPEPVAEGTAAPAAVMPELTLPLPDLSLDRILLIHALEHVERPDALLRECWRVLRENGRLLVVVPNRVGWWSLTDHTPFGQGRPYSRGQIGRLLRSRLFTVERREHALFVPPFTSRWALAGTRLWEAAGRRAFPRFGGVIIAEARKEVLGGLPTGVVPARRVVEMPV
jgi:SAM-dependent methyltransferase